MALTFAFVLQVVLDKNLGRSVGSCPGELLSVCFDGAELRWLRAARRFSCRPRFIHYLVDMNAQTSLVSLAQSLATAAELHASCDSSHASR